jgi:2,3-dimethylmalate lyase
VQEFIRAGVAAVQIEDQEAPKKSATMPGRRVIPADEAVGKIKAAVKARDELDPEFVICARCDSIGAEGESFDNALERAVRYVSEGGADFVWMNSVQTTEQLARACREIPAPVMVIWGSRPGPQPAELEQLGARIALYPVFAATVGAQAAWYVLNDFRERGPQALEDWTERMRSSKWGLPDTASLIGTQRIREMEEAFLPAHLQRDYVSTFGH